MPTKNLQWFTDEMAATYKPAPLPPGYAGYDIHVVRGASSRSLLGDLGLVDDNNVVVVATQPRVDVQKIEFIPLFDATRPTPTRAEGHGVEVDLSTGVVTAQAAAPAPPAPQLRNFILEAQVTVDNPADPAHPTVLKLPIRVHIHRRVGSLWLTPVPLTIPLDNAGWRLSVFAHFETDPPAVTELDSFVGDITRIPDLQWTGGASVVIDAHGRITPQTVGEQEVSVQLPATWGGRQAVGRVVVTEAWGGLPFDRRAAFLVAGPGEAKLDEVLNVLFLSEGFLAGEEDVFSEIVEDLVHETGRSARTRPFDLFTREGSINYWSYFLSSRERGASAVGAMRTRPLVLHLGDGLQIEAQPGSHEPAPNEPVNLEVMFQRVGLPTPADLPPTNPADQNAWRDAKIVEWRTLYGNARVPAGITVDLAVNWGSWGLRTLVDERDTATGLAAGERPRADRSSVFRLLLPHPTRARRGDLDKFIAPLTAGVGGRVIGGVWAGPNAKDRAYVVVLAAGAAFGGEGGSPVVASLVDSGVIRVARGARPHALETVPNPVPTSLPAGRPSMSTLGHAVVIHELGHALGLQDEYSDPGFFNLPRDRRPSLVQQGNVQPVEDFAGSILRGDHLRWRWPRIKKAGVLDDRPVGMGNDKFVISLKKGHKDAFEDGDICYLRQRPLLKPADPAHPEIIVEARRSGKLRVVGRQMGEQVLVADLDGTLSPAPGGDPTFPAVAPFESILYVPVPATGYAQAQGDEHAELVSRTIRDHIDTTNRPLNRLVAACAVHAEQRLAAVDLPANITFWSRGADLFVGAFDGGVRFHCNVIHPSGECLMSTLKGFAPFCPICRYLLVDRVDPSQHGQIDLDYDRRYPEPA